jgi:hypothetical protein
VSFKRKNPKKPINPLKVGQTGRSAANYKTIPQPTEHMARVAALGCLICGQPAQAHHVDILTPKGIGPRPSGYITAPLCERHHTGDQNDCAHIGERAFWQRHGIDIGVWIVRLLTRWYFGRNEDALAAVVAIEATKKLRDPCSARP